MKKYMISLVLLLMLSLVACETPIDASKDLNIKTTLSFETVFSSSRDLPIYEYHTYVIRSKEEEKQTLQNLPPISIDTESGMSNKINLPEIDYSQQMLIGIAFGKQPANVLSGTIDKLVEIDNEVIIYSKLFTSAENFSSGETTPVHFITINKTDANVVFEKPELVNDTPKMYDIAFTRIYNNNHAFTYEQSRNFVIRSKGDEMEFINYLQIQNIDPSFTALFDSGINYAKDMLIVMLPGMTSSGSVKFYIDNIRMDRGKLIVSSTMNWWEAMTDDIGYPVEIAMLNRYDSPVEFLEIKNIPQEKDFSQTDLRATRWTLLSMTDDKGSTITLNEIEEKYDYKDSFTLNFSETLESVGGASGCNVYSAELKINQNNGSIDIFKLISTEAYCEYSGEYSKALMSAYSYELTDEGELVLRCHPNNSLYVELRFTRAD